jgi:preprotein translocase subunit SecD
MKARRRRGRLASSYADVGRMLGLILLLAPAGLAVSCNSAGDELEQRGGVRLVYDADIPSGAQQKAVQRQLLHAIRERMTAAGFKNAHIYAQGNNQVVIDLATEAEDAEHVKEIVSARGLPAAVAPSAEYRIGPLHGD